MVSKAGEEPVPMLGSVKRFRGCHGGDFNAEFAEDANRPVHVKVACEQNLLAGHALDQTRRLDAVFAGTGRSPLGDHDFARNAAGYQEVEDAGAATAADHNFLEAPVCHEKSAWRARQ